MTKPASEDQVTEPIEPPQEARLSDEQLEGVAGAGDGRKVIDCEGYTPLSSSTLSAPAKLKQPE
jgi:hypothetical protein